MNMNRGLLTIVALGLAWFGWGCTYVNIPAQEGDVAWHDPNNHTVREVLTRSIKALLEEQPIEGRFVVLMPDGSSAERYVDLNLIVKEYDARAWRSVIVTDATPAIQVKQLRVRGSEAQVDLVREVNPLQPDPFNRLVTAELRWQAPDGWYAARLRQWRSGPPGRIERAPLATARAPTPEAPVLGAPEPPEAPESPETVDQASASAR